MQKKVLASVVLFLLLSVPAMASFETAFTNFGNFLKSDSLTGFMVFGQQVQAEDTSRVIRSGLWTQSNGENTVLITSKADSTLTFSFTGTSLGVVVYRNDPIKATVSIDGNTYDIDTSRMSGNCWTNSKDYCEVPIASGLTSSVHTVTLKTINDGVSFHIDSFVINAGTPASPSTTTCNDPDGQNFYSKERVYSSAYQSEGGNRADFCSSTTLVEQICSGNTPSSIRFSCPNGCNDGACNQASACSAYHVLWKDGKRSYDGTGVGGYNTLTEGPSCKNGAWYWCTRASENANCFGCYTGNICSTGSTCQQSPYFDFNSDGKVTDADTSECNECIGRYLGSCTRCDFNGDCAVTLSDVELQRTKKTLDCTNPEIKNTKYIDGIKTDRTDGIAGFDKVTYGPICTNNVMYWCTQSTKESNCYGCYTGNSCSITSQKPDLTVDDIQISTTPYINNDLTILITLKNNGNAAAKILDYQVSAGVTTTFVSNTFDGELSPGESAIVSIKARYGTIGTARINVKADPSNRVDELREDNNELVKEIYIGETTQTTPQTQTCENKLYAICTTSGSSWVTVKINPITTASSYLLEWRRTGTDKWSGCSDAKECGSTRNTATTIEAIGLSPYTTYQFRARIESGSCSGSNSEIFYCSTKEESTTTGTTCESLRTVPYVDGVRTPSGNIRYGYDTLIAGPYCNNGVTRWCTQASQKSECSSCDTGKECTTTIQCQLGYRTGSQYCDATGQYRQQKTENNACDNDFECTTNTCASGTCTDLKRELKEQKTILDRIMKLLFG